MIFWEGFVSYMRTPTDGSSKPYMSTHSVGRYLADPRDKDAVALRRALIDGVSGHKVTVWPVGRLPPRVVDATRVRPRSGARKAARPGRTTRWQAFVFAREGVS